MSAEAFRLRGWGLNLGCIEDEQPLYMWCQLNQLSLVFLDN